MFLKCKTFPQAWNHEFYWNCMKAGGGGKPTGPLLAQIEKDFGSFEEFSKQFDTAGQTAFGSGWAWLSWDGSKLVRFGSCFTRLRHPRAAGLTVMSSFWRNVRPEICEMPRRD